VYGLNPLRRARQERGLTLQQVAALTKLSPHVLRSIELGDFGALPSGVQGRAHIRAYAHAVGLDPDEVLKGLADRLPAEHDPIAAWRARQRERFDADHPVAAMVRSRAEAWQRRAMVVVTAPRRPVGPPGPLRYVAAGAVDGTILGLFGGIMLIASAWITRTDLPEVWRAGRWPLLVSGGSMAVLYGVLSQGLGRRTPGAAITEWLRRKWRLRHGGLRLGRWHVWN
jgi:transcriptional regulator with XRE-family HTH domain